MIFYYIRHGDPIYNPDSLTPRGQLQAEAVAKRFGVHGLDRVFSSDSNRAVMTAKPTCELLNLPLTQLPWCNENRPWERMCVFYEDGRREYVFEDPASRILFASDEFVRLGYDWGTHDTFKDTTIPACLEEIRRDSDEFFASLGYRRDPEKHAYIPENPTDERIALFAHQAFGMAFLSCVLDIPYPQFCTRFDMGHTGVTAIEFREQNGLVIPRVLQLSNDSHLYREGLPTRYQNRVYL
ncbi:MAG: histidine phosphatase family protein [Clostridia bacterium]|nr:histidine phosphatase family protein [Clostridia bacterium]